MRSNLWILCAAISLLAVGCGGKPQAVTPEAVATNPAPKTCQRAAGNIIDGITLYSDSSCSTVIGTVAGIGKTPGGQKTVFVSQGGKTEQVSRDQATSWYVKN
jgi:hypothetical protein